MIKRIIFLVGSRFNLRDYGRFGIRLLQDNGFNVEVWDLTAILYPEFFKGYAPLDIFNYDGLRQFNNKSQMYDKLSSLSNTDFVVSELVYTYETLEVHRALSKSNTEYALSYPNVPPVPRIRKKLLCLLLDSIKNLVGLRHSAARKRLFMRLPLKWHGVKPARLIIVGGDRYMEGSHYFKYPIDKDTEALWCHFLDYDIYLKEKDMPYTEQRTAVFLDEFLPFHSDYYLSPGYYPFDKKDSNGRDIERYYSLLNEFFDVVEEKTGLEVVIAAHPRSDYENRPDYFKGRRCIRGKTAGLIKECKLVLCHCSIALGFAILFHKPVIFMTFSELDRSCQGYDIRNFAERFGKNQIFIDDKYININWEKELTVSKEHYDNYRKGYMKTEHSEDLPVWQIVANRLKKGL